MVRGNAFSHHWGYGEIYGGDQHPYDNDNDSEKETSKVKEKKKNFLKPFTDLFARWLERLAKENEKNPPCCGCGGCR